MEISDIRKELKTEKYSFLKDNEHLGKNVILLGLGGSHAYGTSNENSDIDVRGIAVNSKNEILTNQKFVQMKRQIQLFTHLIRLFHCLQIQIQTQLNCLD